MKKHFYLLGSLFLISSGLLNAQPAGLLNAQQKPSRQSQSKPESVTTQPKGMITPAVAPKVRDGAGLIFTADFIWWKTTISGMEYAANGVIDTGIFVPLGVSTKRGHVNQPNFDFEPGFKVGAGLDFAYDGWDLYADYTWLNGDTERNSISAHHKKGATTLFPIVDSLGTITTVDIAKEKSKWHQNFNVVDLELGRNFFISRHLTLRPHVGLKSAWIREKWKLKFVENNEVFKDFQQRKQTLWGLGTRVGLNSVWHFSRNWGLYGDIAATALWSDFHVKAKDRVTNPSIDSSTTTLHTKEVITEVIPVFETGLGLTYMTWFDNEQYLFSVSAGWEEQIWLDFNHFVDYSRSGNLSVHGLTVKLGFAF